MLSLTWAVVCRVYVFPHFSVALLYARRSFIQLHPASCLFDLNFAMLLADGLLVIIREETADSERTDRFRSLGPSLNDFSFNFTLVTEFWAKLVNCEFSLFPSRHKC